MANLVNVVIPPLDSPLTYGVPESLASQVAVGSRVEVPLGRRRALGYVVATNARPPLVKDDKKIEVKSVFDTDEPLACFSREQLDFFQWIADYYGEPLSNVIDVAIPPVVPRRFERLISLSSKLPEKLPAKSQGELLRLLAQEKAPVDLESLGRRVKGASRVVKSLQAKGLVRLIEREIVDQHLSDAEPPPAWAKESVELNQAQRLALDAINSALERRLFEAFVLHGITGSGKTEVYIEAIKHAQERGLGALIIVPEIALTPQLIDRFRARLGQNIGVLHSALHKRSRWDSWRALLEGRCTVAIGARSGIFAPVKNLGLIIVDEEHESSYKQAEGLRYNARDLALVRAKLQKCSVVLGSATPSLETYLNAVTGKYKLLSLPSRHAASQSLEMQVVDLNTVKPWDMPSKNISPQLAEAITQALERKEQVFLLYNRRGFASYLQCEVCQTTVDCPNCSVTLTYHKHRNSLQCHYCNLSVLSPQYCSQCQGSDGKGGAPLLQRGAGTEKIFDELLALFPQARIARLDRDAVQDAASYRALLDAVRDGSTDILVGTQMIAKGHDLPGVTLVGVIDCDVGLHMPDFRAGERVFQLLTQASGRAGRGDKPGSVVLQTRAPKNHSIVMTQQRDFDSFAKIELNSRKNLSYPPYTRILRIIISAANRDYGARFARALRGVIDASMQARKYPLVVLGPTTAPIEKLRALWRWHYLIKAKSASQLNRIMHDVQHSITPNNHVRVVFDMDPQDLM